MIGQLPSNLFQAPKQGKLYPAPRLLRGVYLRVAKDGVDAVGGTPEEFRQQIAREIAQLRDVGRSSNIKLEQ